MKNKDKRIKELEDSVRKAKGIIMILIVFSVLSIVFLTIGDVKTNDLEQQLQSYQEELDIPEDLVFKYSCYWENLGIYQEIHLELDDFETYNGWLYKLKNEDLYRYCEVIK